jgi:hypothetical protein
MIKGLQQIPSRPQSHQLLLVPKIKILQELEIEIDEIRGLVEGVV